MQHRKLKVLFGCVLLLWVASFCGCSEQGAGASKDPKSSAETAIDGLGELSSAEHLKLALAWAKGKTPEAMVAELAEMGWDNANESLSWRYYIVQIVFAEAYGKEAAAQRMQEAFAESAAAKQSSRHSRQEPRYNGNLGRHYPEIYELALQEPQRALDELDQLLLHPDELLSLKAEALIAYGAAHPLKALELLAEKTDIVTYHTQKSIVLNWAKEDAAAALRYVDELNEERSMLGLRHALLLDMVEYDPSRALEAAADSPINHQTNWTFEKVAESYIRQNPETGFEWLMQQESLSANLLEAGVDGLSSGHPDLADALMKTVEPERWQSHFLRNIAAAKAERDLSAALTWASQLPWESHRSYAYQNVLTVMARDQPEQLVATLGSIQDMGITTKGYSIIVDNLAKHHPETALRWIRSVPDSPASARLLGLAGEQIMKRNPNRIGELLAIMGQGKFNSAGIGKTVKGWLDANPGEAIAWVKNHATAEQLESIIPEIEKKWSNMDAKAAVDFAQTLPPGKARAAILVRYVRSESATDLRGVVQTLNSMQPGEDLHQLMNDAFVRGAAGNTDAAKTLALSVKDPATRDLAIRGVMSALYKEDVSEAAKWAQQVDFATVKNMKYALNPIVDNWARNDTGKLLDWVATLNDPETRQHAALRSTYRIDKDDTATAARLINLAPADNGRTREVMNAVRRLPDSYARDAFVSSIFLSKQEQDQIRKEREGNKL